MADAAPPPSRNRLVGQPLLYAISIFASLGVFLVRLLLNSSLLPNSPPHLSSSVTIKGNPFPTRASVAPCAHLPQLASCLVSSPDPILDSFSTRQVL